MLLNCHTYFSLRYGTLSPEALITDCQKKGYRKIAVTDINNTSAIIECLRISSENNLQIVPGIDFRNGIKQQYVGIARNNRGYRELNEHLSKHLHQSLSFEKYAPQLENCFIVYPFAAYSGKKLKANEFVGLSPAQLKSYAFRKSSIDRKKLVLLQPVSFQNKREHNAHRLLRAIDLNTLLSKLPAAEQAPLDEMAPFLDELIAACSGNEDIVENTIRLLDACKVEITFGKLSNKNLKYYTGTREGDQKLLREKAEEGIAYRYPQAGTEVLKRVEKELAVINRMDFASYFLINWDIVSYARSKGYFYVGRGSGANSIIAYLLRITDVDPIELDLYFERFINEHRSNAPDFDIDFSWTDRDDITRYIFRRFGMDRTALLGTYSTFQRDAVLRELGKVFGLPPAEIDKLQAYKRAQENDSLGQLVLKYSELIHGFPNQLSIHASGIVISEEPISSYTATFIPPKGYPTTQFSMLEAEDIGLFKFDILSQRGLGKIKDAVGIIKQNRGTDIDIHDVKKFKSDEKVRDILREGKCIGCFYVESPAMRMLLAKLRADDYLRLVAASSIIRPGVSKSGMMREYIVRYRRPELREKARKRMPTLYDLLSETYGVMVYQEDVIRVAHEFADLTLAEADYLRRGMSWKFKQRNEFWKVKEKFFSNCAGKGYPAAVTQDVWDQIESFANFAFSKGHSASYAVESYQALYLKAHYPIEYLVATINNGGGFYRKEIYLHEARMHGATIEPPCINRSRMQAGVSGSTIVLGLESISGLEEDFVAGILERRSEGEFVSLFDFVKRVKPGIEQVRLLIRAGCFRCIDPDKKKLLWEAHQLINPRTKPATVPDLFEINPEKFVLPELEHSWIDEAYDQLELLGFMLDSPFKLLKKRSGSTLLAGDLKQLKGREAEIEGYLVAVKDTRSSDGRKMHFGTFLDRKGEWIDTVHFPESAAKFPFTGPGCYSLRGKVTEEFDFITLEVSEMHRLPVFSREDQSVPEEFMPVKNL